MVEGPTKERTGMLAASVAEAIKNTNVDGFAASNIFHHYDQSVYLARKYLHDKKYNVREPMILDL
jgi:cyclase